LTCPHMTKAVARAKALHADEDKMGMLRKAFGLFDLSGGGTIEVNDLCALLRGMGVPVTDSEARDIVTEVC
jgi:Ca2+-binding EF-hand superfamily protein